MSDFLTFVQGAFVNKVLSVANQWTQVGQINGSGNFANVSLNFANISPTQSDTISIAISANSTSPNNDDIIESNIPMPVAAVLSRENIIANEGEYVYILATTDNIACRIAGITQALQSMEEVDAEIITLSSEIEYLSGAIDTNVANLQNEINSLQNTLNTDVAQLNQDIASSASQLQSEINSLSANLESQISADVNNLQSEINSLSSQLNSDDNNLQNQINGLSSQLSSDNGNLQNQINGLSSQLSSDNGNLQNQINNINSNVGSLFGSVNNVTGSRGLGGTYYNGTGKPMMVLITAGTNNPGQNSTVINFVINGQVVQTNGTTNVNGEVTASISAIVPAGSYYQANSVVYASLSEWVEIS